MGLESLGGQNIRGSESHRADINPTELKSHHLHEDRFGRQLREVQGVDDL